MNVKLISNKDDILRGDEPPLIEIEKGSSAQLFIRSPDAISYNKSKLDFNIDVLTVFQKAKAFKLKSVSIHKPPNVSNYSKKLRIKHDLGETQYFYLKVGWYTPVEFCNMLINSIQNQFIIDGIADSLACSFDSIKSIFTISSTGGFNFFFDNSSEFCTRGLYMHGFKGEPWGNTPSKSFFDGIRAELLYTSFCTIHAPTLCRNASSGYSMSSDKNISTWDLIASVNLLNFTDKDWDISPSYTTTLRHSEILSAPKISLRGVNNSVIYTSNILNIYFLDGFGLDMGKCYNDDQTGYEGDIGALLFFEIYY